MTAHKNILVETIMSMNTKALEDLVLARTHTTAQFSSALVLAASEGLNDIVKILLEASDPRFQDSAALREAAANGHLECVRTLVPVSNPKAQDHHAMRAAAQNGHAAVVAALMSHFNVDAPWTLKIAAERGHADVVSLLIPVSNTFYNDSQALYWALKNRKTECAKRLVPVSDAEVVKKRLVAEGDDEATLILGGIVQENTLRQKYLAMEKTTRTQRRNASP